MTSCPFLRLTAACPMVGPVASLTIFARHAIPTADMLVALTHFAGVIALVTARTLLGAVRMAEIALFLVDRRVSSVCFPSRVHHALSLWHLRCPLNLSRALRSRLLSSHSFTTHRHLAELRLRLEPFLGSLPPAPPPPGCLLLRWPPPGWGRPPPGGVR